MDGRHAVVLLRVAEGGVGLDDAHIKAASGRCGQRAPRPSGHVGGLALLLVTRSEPQWGPAAVG